MSKKTTSIPQPRNNKAELLIDRETFKNELVQRIEIGKNILAMPVRCLNVNADPYYGHFGRTSSKPQYDKEQKDAFMTAESSWHDYNCELLKQRFNIEENEYREDYIEAGRAYIITSQTDLVELTREEIKKRISTLESLIQKLTLIPVHTQTDTSVKTNKRDINPRKVFIVHGHDNAKRTDAELLVRELGLEPVVLFKQTNGGKTIIEKLEQEVDEVSFAIVLYTACDKGSDNESTELRPRARQNVVFEHGYLNGKLGRQRVVALVEDGVEIPGDLSGLVYIKIDPEGNWRFRIAREMKSAGLPIDLNTLA